MNLLRCIIRFIKVAAIVLGLLIWPVVWPMAVTYFPNHYDVLVRSAVQAYSRKLDSTKIRAIADSLPNDGPVIEAYVKEKLVQYRLPWQSYNLPWVYLTVDEILEEGYGDCQAQALVMDALLTQKGIRHSVKASIDHIWVEYPSRKPVGNLEKPTRVIVVVEDSSWRWPEIHWQESYEVEKAYFYDPMPFIFVPFVWLGWIAELGFLLWQFVRGAKYVWRTLTAWRNNQQLEPA